MRAIAAGLLLAISACAAPAPVPPPAAPTSPPATAAPTAQAAAAAKPAIPAPAPTEPAPAVPTADAMAKPVADGAAKSTAVSVTRPAWQNVQLTDARSGKTFTLADFAGKTVYVEPFATWCTNCRALLTNVKAAKAQLGDQHVFVALSVETNLKTADITKYTNERGFDWVFAVMTPELLKQLTDEFGLTIANPPTTPHFIIRADGSTTPLVNGIESAEALVASLKSAVR